MRLHLHEWGCADAPPVVCLHGVTSHGARFAHLAERLSGFRVLAPDLRGHGRSGWEPPWRLETHVEDVLETAAAVRVDTAAWIGHSFGGRVLLELAARCPECIERVVPVSSTRVAEMVKLLENTFRSVNIGLVNEVALMCNALRIDVWEVIEAAKTKPFGFMPFYPGPGLGGHCIPIDPFYLSWKAKMNGF